MERGRMTTMERAFWAWVDRRMTEPDTAGLNEQAFLDTIKTPGWSGMRARTKSAPANAAPMPAVRDGRMAAANDAD